MNKMLRVLVTAVFIAGASMLSGCAGLDQSPDGRQFQQTPGKPAVSPAEPTKKAPVTMASRGAQSRASGTAAFNPFTSFPRQADFCSDGRELFGYGREKKPANSDVVTPLPYER